ncbi:MAG TPA: oxygen-dependent coproporphyrinogen oxidase [Candidatus Tumulicola sp.]|nr:oxygen-dependent coproporphyrinogen oxidase [Candidatus Tumulicola sp.]
MSGTSTATPLAKRAQEYFENLQRRLVVALETMDGGARFRADRWERAEGGGGLTQILSGGALFEKAGVNTSAVWGDFDAAALSKLGGSQRRFFAAGVSLVLHPDNPMVPTVHANFRYLERGDDAWFGGGSDLTPYYPYKEDVAHFHRTWRDVCDRFDPAYYPRFKRWCDEYFYLPHRKEARGVGGIFFDDLRGDPEETFAFVRACGDTFMDAYAPIASRRRGESYGERERLFQAYRRGRYVEFNLLYDRGTSFGLATHGRTESILMSLPPLARWDYGWQPEAGSREEQAMTFFQPHEWLV